MARSLTVAARHRRRRGVTLLELLAAVALLALLLSQAVPSFADLRDRHALAAAAATLRADLRLARREARRRGRAVHFSVRDLNTGWCYGYALAAGCDCRHGAAASRCELDGSANGVTLRRRVEFTAAADFSFSAARGLSRTGTLRLRSTSGRELRLLRSALGRIRLCAAPPAPGYTSC